MMIQGRCSERPLLLLSSLSFFFLSPSFFLYLFVLGVHMWVCESLSFSVPFVCVLYLSVVCLYLLLFIFSLSFCPNKALSLPFFSVPNSDWLFAFKCTKANRKALALFTLLSREQRIIINTLNPDFRFLGKRISWFQVGSDTNLFQTTEVTKDTWCLLLQTWSHTFMGGAGATVRQGSMERDHASMPVVPLSWRLSQLS